MITDDLPAMTPLSLKRCFLSIPCFCLGICTQALSQADSVSIKAGTTAYNQFKLRDSRIIFEKIATSRVLPVYDRVEAIQNLASQDWKIFNRYAESVNRLQSAVLLNCQKAKTYILLGQINQEALHYTRAMTFANLAIETSADESDKLNAFLLKARIIYNKSLTGNTDAA
jgi:hypothetical protein